MRVCRVCQTDISVPEPIKGRNVCRICINEYSKTYKRSNPDKAKQAYAKTRDITIQRAVKWNRENTIARKSITRTWRWKLRLEMIEAYGGSCSCCGEKEPEFLSIDHVNNDGYTKRINGEGVGASLYRKLRDRGWPKDEYQLLCMNCNFAKGHFGECPHTRLDSNSVLADRRRMTFDNSSKENKWQTI